MDGRGQVAELPDEDMTPVIPMLSDDAAPPPDEGALPSPSLGPEPRPGIAQTGEEFSDAAGMLDSLDPLAAHMDALRRQLGGNFRDLTTHGDDPSLVQYVEGEGDGEDGSGLPLKKDEEDPREFYQRVMEHQRRMEEEGEEGQESRDELLSNVPPVTTEEAAHLAAQYEDEHSAVRSAPAPDDESFEAAPIKPDQPVWIRDAPDRTPVRGEGDSDDEDLALLKLMAGLAVERSPGATFLYSFTPYLSIFLHFSLIFVGVPFTGGTSGAAEVEALGQADNELAEALESVARGDSMLAESVAEDGTVVDERSEDLAWLGSAVDSQIASLAAGMLTADEILNKNRAVQVGEEGSGEDDEDDDPVATLLAIAAQTRAELYAPQFEEEASWRDAGGSLEAAAKDLTSMGVPLGEIRSPSYSLISRMYL